MFYAEVTHLEQNCTCVHRNGFCCNLIVALKFQLKEGVCCVCIAPFDSNCSYWVICYAIVCGVTLKLDLVLVLFLFFQPILRLLCLPGKT